MTNKTTPIKATLASALLATTALTTSIEAWANELRAAEFAAISNNSFEIVLNFTDGAPDVNAFTTDEPARLVFDFAGVDNGMNQRKFDIGFSNGDSAMLLDTDDRLRMVVNLDKITTYTTNIDGDQLRILVGDSSAASYHASSQTAIDSFKKSVHDGKLNVQNIDFTRDEKGAGLITLSLSDPDAVVSVERNSNGLAVQLKDARIPQHLQKQFDVNDFGTPVSRLQATNNGNDAVLLVEPSTQHFDYLAYQVGNTYQISMTPLTKQEIEEKKNDFSGVNVSYDFQDIEVRAVLGLLANANNLNLVVSDSVTGSITLTLNDTPWDQALDIILKTQGLDKRLTGNVLLVAPANEIAAREQQELENQMKLKELEPLVTEHIQIKYADAKEMFNLFSNAGQDDNSILSDRGRAVVDERTNSIILTDTAHNIGEFKSLIDKLDVAVKQVSIESRIVIAGNDARRDLGVRWGFDRASDRMVSPNVNQNVISSGSIDSVLQVANGDTIIYGAEGQGSGAGALAVDLGATPQAGNAASLAVGFLSGNQNFVTLELSALEAEGKAQVVSQPKVITGDKQKAIIRTGQEIAYQQASSSGATNVQFKEAALKLEVIPQITPDNRVQMTLYITKNTIGQVVEGVPTLDITEIETRVYADNGQTIVLGGIFEESEVDSVTGVPVLKDIPFIGGLFKNKSKSLEKTETLIFITPRILSSSLDSAGQPRNMLGDQVESDIPSYYK